MVGAGYAIFTKKVIYDWMDKSQRGEWTKRDQDLYDFVSRTPGLNYFTELYKSEKEREWYMNRNQLDYSKIRQPWDLPGNSEAGIFGPATFDFISDNATRLFRNWDRATDQRNAERRRELEREQRRYFHNRGYRW